MNMWCYYRLLMILSIYLSKSYRQRHIPHLKKVIKISIMLKNCILKHGIVH